MNVFSGAQIIFRLPEQLYYMSFPSLSLERFRAERCHRVQQHGKRQEFGDTTPKTRMMCKLICFTVTEDCWEPRM